jgi:hypothetical protein
MAEHDMEVLGASESTVAFQALVDAEKALLDRLSGAPHSGQFIFRPSLRSQR